MKRAQNCVQWRVLMLAVLNLKVLIPEGYIMSINCFAWIMFTG
jgi:hypothetical protein